MERERYTAEDDQIIVCMANKGATNQQIAEFLGMGAQGICDRKKRLRTQGYNIRRAPIVRTEPLADSQESLRVDDPEESVSTDQSDVEVEYPETSFGEVDALELLKVEIDNLNRNEADLLDQLDCVRAEKFNISMKLNKLLESLNTLETLKEDPS